MGLVRPNPPTGDTHAASLGGVANSLSGAANSLTGSAGTDTHAADIDTAQTNSAEEALETFALGAFGNDIMTSSALEQTLASFAITPTTANNIVVSSAMVYLRSSSTAGVTYTFRLKDGSTVLASEAITPATLTGVTISLIATQFDVSSASHTYSITGQASSSVVVVHNVASVFAAIGNASLTGSAGTDTHACTGDTHACTGDTHAASLSGAAGTCD